MVLLVLLKNDGTMNGSIKFSSNLLFEKTSLFTLIIKGTTGIFEGLKYRGKLFGLISNDGE